MQCSPEVCERRYIVDDAQTSSSEKYKRRQGSAVTSSCVDIIELWHFHKMHPYSSQPKYNVFADGVAPRHRQLAAYSHT